MGFVADQLMDGRRFRILTLVDQVNRACPVLKADFSLTGQWVALTLEQLANTRSILEVITVDHGSEFISKELDLTTGTPGCPPCQGSARRVHGQVPLSTESASPFAGYRRKIPASVLHIH